MIAFAEFARQGNQDFRWHGSHSRLGNCYKTETHSERSGETGSIPGQILRSQLPNNAQLSIRSLAGKT